MRCCRRDCSIPLVLSSGKTTSLKFGKPRFLCFYDIFGSIYTNKAVDMNFIVARITQPAIKD